MPRTITRICTAVIYGLIMIQYSTIIIMIIVDIKTYEGFTEVNVDELLRNFDVRKGFFEGQSEN